MIKFAIDRGGTFTDIYASCNGKIYIKKLLSIDSNYEDAPREGIRTLLENILRINLSSGLIPIEQIDWIRMGTTVSTNALLERKGSKVALIVTKGFADVLEIGYQNRADIFDLNIKKTKMLYSKVFEVNERVVVDSKNSFKVLNPINTDELRSIFKEIKSNGFDSVAISFLHSYGFDSHEKIAYKIAKEEGIDNISLSSEVLPIVKYINRTSSSVVDSYLTPHIREYINSFKSKFRDGIENLFFMQSNGGLTLDRDFRGTNSILSGPAGGVVGYSSIFKEKPIIGFDMGGTSTDISRFDGEFDLSFENEIDGIKNDSPQMNIITVASGGGSRLFYKNSMFVVGPESSSADPGPICYKKGGHLSVTDANLLLNRIVPEFFPKIFGKNCDEALDFQSTKEAFEKLAIEVNRDYKERGLRELDIYEIAYGFIKVANENMIKPIKELSALKGFDISEHILASFGGAGGQHSNLIAKSLGIKEVFVHRYSGILSAYGLAVADIIKDYQESVNLKYSKKSLTIISNKFDELISKHTEEIEEKFRVERYLSMRYRGTSSSFIIKESDSKNYKESFKSEYLKIFGFDLDERDIDIDKILIKIIIDGDKIPRERIQTRGKIPLKPIFETKVYFESKFLDTKVYNLDDLYFGDIIESPAIILNQTSTTIIEPECFAKITEFGDIQIIINDIENLQISKELTPLNLALFNNLFTSTAEQMGRMLQRSAISTNIKERLDFSCAIFDSCGNLVANAPHIPVHLGSLSHSVKYIIDNFDIGANDVFITNSPFEGGSHLPDITLITPYIENSKVQFFVASRAHHSDIGGATAGSMPSFSTSIYEEGAVIKAFKIIDGGKLNEQKLLKILNRAGAREITDNLSDINAQISANLKGINILKELSGKYSIDVVKLYMGYIQDVSEKRIREFFKNHKTKHLKAVDFLDDGTKIAIKIDILNDEATFDFSDCSIQSLYNQNAPKSITYSAIVYVLRALIGENFPLNEGFLKPIKVIFKDSSILNPDENLAVVGGNVTTSQRVVDVLLEAFGVCASSCGCMNNLSFGNDKFGYYETIGGGAGASLTSNGASGVHTHMTNTRITDAEIFERRYPVILREFSINRDSGGKGEFSGGDGLIREIEFLDEVRLNLLTERRALAPKGLNGGEDGERGENILIRKKASFKLGSKVSLNIQKGDRVIIKTPSGGGANRI